MYFYLIVALQGYCLYHIYKNRNSYYWMFLIFFVPAIGSIIYLMTQVYNSRDAEKIQDGIASIINPTKKVIDLEKNLQFSESYQNRINLADAYLEIMDYNNAIPHYLDALDDGSQNDFYAINKLVEVYYLLKDYDNVILYAEKIQNQFQFKKSSAQFIYGLAQDKLGNFKTAETNLRSLNIRFSYYKERLALSKFLISRNKKEDAKEILNEVLSESQHMTGPNKRIFKATIQEAEKLLADL